MGQALGFSIYSEKKGKDVLCQCSIHTEGWPLRRSTPSSREAIGSAACTLRLFKPIILKISLMRMRNSPLLFAINTEF